MNEKKFYLPGIIVPAAAILLNLFLGVGIIDLVVAPITFIINWRKRKTHRIAIGVVLAAAILVGFAITAYCMCVVHSMEPSQSTKDLIMSILFGFSS